MPAQLMINAPELDAESLQELTRELCLELNQETDFDAELPESAIQPGTKGGDIPYGQIALKWSKLGVEKLTALLKIFFERSESLEFTVEGEGANRKATLKISKRDLNDKHIKETQKLLSDILRNSNGHS